jgi:hypothetical protein
LDEKNHPVAMMDEIYSNAIRAFVWLGQGDEAAHKFFGLLENVRQNEDPWCSTSSIDIPSFWVADNRQRFRD